MNFVTKVKEAKELIEWTKSKYPKSALACSFGKDSMVVLHLALEIDPNFPVFSIMTPFKFRETFSYKKKMTKQWRLNINTFMAKLLPYELTSPPCLEPDVCCNDYKVEPTRLATKGLDAWITGLRRTEGRTRTDYEFIEDKGGLIKVNPILDFTELDVWRYLAVNEIPVNPLYKEGYRSLGCKPCSNKEKDENETEREGRWQGTSKCGGECGIHTQVLR